MRERGGTANGGGGGVGGGGTVGGRRTCHAFAANGTCKFGDRCHFLHETSGGGRPSAALVGERGPPPSYSGGGRDGRDGRDERRDGPIDRDGWRSDRRAGGSGAPSGAPGGAPSGAPAAQPEAQPVARLSRCRRAPMGDGARHP